MTPSLESYTPFRWPFEPKHRLAGIVNELESHEAEGFYERVMDRRAEALSEICEISTLDSADLPLESSQLKYLNQWYCSGIESSEDPFDLSPNWYSVSLDIALIIGGSVVKQREHLHWAFCRVDEDSISFQMPVLEGFQNVINPDYYHDVIADVVTIGRKELVIRNPKLKLSQPDNTIQKNTIGRQVKTILGNADNIRLNSFTDIIETCLELA